MKKKTLIGIVGSMATISAAVVPLSCMTSCQEASAKNVIVATEGYKLEEDIQASVGHVYKNSIVSVAGNDDIITSLQVISGSEVLNPDTDYVWDINPDKSSGHLLIKNIKDNVVINVNHATRVNDTIHYHGDVGHIYRNRDDYFEFTFVGINLPAERKIDSVTIADASGNPSTVLEVKNPESIYVEHDYSIGVEVGFAGEAQDLTNYTFDMIFNYVTEAGEEITARVPSINIVGHEENADNYFRLDMSKSQLTVADPKQPIILYYDYQGDIPPVGDIVNISFAPGSPTNISLDENIVDVKHDDEHSGLAISLHYNETQTTTSNLDLFISFLKNKWETVTEPVSVSTKLDISQQIKFTSDGEYDQAFYTNDSILAYEFKYEGMPKGLTADDITVNLYKTGTKEKLNCLKVDSVYFEAINTNIFNVNVNFVPGEIVDEVTMDIEIQVEGGEFGPERSDKTEIKNVRLTKSIPIDEKFLKYDGTVFKGFDEAKVKANLDEFHKQTTLLIKNTTTKFDANFKDVLKSSSSTYKTVNWVILDERIAHPKAQKPVLESIRSTAFENCTALNGYIYIPKSVKKIDNYAFKNADNIQRVLFDLPQFKSEPSSLETIGYEAFYSCDNLKGNIILPDSVKTLSEYCFSDNYNIGPYVHIPSNLTYSTAKGDKGRVFKNDKNILYLDSDINFTSTEDDLLDCMFQGATSFVGYVPADKTVGQITIPSQILRVHYHAFENCKISTVIFPHTTQNLRFDDSAFKCQKTISTIDFSNWVSGNINNDKGNAFSNLPDSGVLYAPNADRAKYIREKLKIPSTWEVIYPQSGK